MLDIMLPALDGYKVCETLRGEGSWMPILMLTAKDGEGDQVEALDTGADGYVTKPFLQRPVARLRSMLRRGAHERPATLAVGDLVLDPATRRVRRGEVELELTTRELSLLEFRMRRRGHVVSWPTPVQGVRARFAYRGTWVDADGSQVMRFEAHLESRGRQLLLRFLRRPLRLLAFG